MGGFGFGSARRTAQQVNNLGGARHGCGGAENLGWKCARQAGSGSGINLSRAQNACQARRDQQGPCRAVAARAWAAGGSHRRMNLSPARWSRRLRPVQPIYS
jgi:hypothetical protein